MVRNPKQPAEHRLRTDSVAWLGGPPPTHSPAAAALRRRFEINRRSQAGESQAEQGVAAPAGESAEHRRWLPSHPVFREGAGFLVRPLPQYLRNQSDCLLRDERLA
jgi:hypothetical protein